jgi:integrase
MHRNSFFGRPVRPGLALPDFTKSRPRQREDLDNAHAAVRALGAVPPPIASRNIYAQTSDGHAVTIRSNQPLNAAVLALERKVGARVIGVREQTHRTSIPVEDGERVLYVSPMNRHLAAAGISSAWRDDDGYVAHEICSMDDMNTHRLHFHERGRSSALLSERAAGYLRWLAQKNTCRSSVFDAVWTLRILIEMVGDKPVGQIGLDDADTFLHAVGSFPSNASKRREYRGMRAPEIITKARILQTPLLNMRTQQKHIDRLRAFFRWLERRKEVMPDLLRGVRLYNRRKDIGRPREPFSEDELRLIFEAHRCARFTTPYQYWAPPFGLYQALRVNELGQLYVDDVVKKDGLWCLNISRDRPGQRLKNCDSRRFIPIHPVILANGFLDFVQQAKDWNRTTLFPDVVWGVNGPGDSIGDWFNRSFLRNQLRITNKAKTYHSFRHCFATYGEESGVRDTRLALLLGHSSGESVLRKTYMHTQKIPPQKLMVDLEAIKFPEFEHMPYDPGLFVRAFEQAAAEERRQEKLNAVYGRAPTRAA